MATPFKELAGSPTEEFADGGMLATRTLLCAWSARYAFVRDILGDAYGLGGEGVADYPGQTLVKPTRVRLEPFTDDVESQVLADLSTGLNTYRSFAKVTVDYQTVTTTLPGGETIELQENTWLTYRVNGATEVVVATADNNLWDGDGSKVKDPDILTVQRIPVVEHHLSWHNVITPPMAAINAVSGKVNSEVWHGFAPETMLFDTYDADKEFVLLDDGNVLITAWKLNYIFRERRVNIPVVPPLQAGTIGGWNHYYRTKPQANMGWDRLKDVNGNPPYESATAEQLDKLFKYVEVQ